ncbi:MAG TPA: hypothetical protein VH593_28740 [Ktedonobacteraceae bacterium]|jgi:hypothetical protein
MTTGTTEDPPSNTLQWREQLQQRAHQLLLKRIASDPSIAHKTLTTKEHRFYTLGFILSALSIFGAFFPICGLPIAISGLIIGIRGRHIPELRHTTSWTIALSILGLVLAIINIVISLFIYFSIYLWQ